ncbi:MAG TPA: 1-deoxy-D-xylulose-5-phosphate reductoisomerase [Gemmataceae bacterium]|nr:1-deoxy-D-xylulose-5-phosphate reductoisomerase [Gemmataceae bacterium]
MSEPATAAGSPTQRRRVVVLGSTGSIGTNCLDVIDQLPGRLQGIGLCAHSNWQALFEQAKRHRPRWICVTDTEVARQLDASELGDTQLLIGPDGVREMVSDPDVDIVVSAIVGAAGLEGTWAALEAGKTVAVANKETLVMAGPLVMELAAKRNAGILPVDSEHSALFQAMCGGSSDEIEQVVLTASGGPFRGCQARDLADVTPDEALRHPTWRMGPKITIDSATLMNKALEVIEARWLFGLPPEKIDVIIHPESIVHSFVEFVDGSVLAQLSPPDMRLPIQYALTYPERVAGPARRLSWRELSTFHFEQVDHDTFPAVQLGYEVARRGGTCGAVLNAANEAAVSRFLACELRFLDIPRACRDVLAHHDYSPRPSLAELAAHDRWARQEVSRWIISKHRNVPVA